VLRWVVSCGVVLHWAVLYETYGTGERPVRRVPDSSDLEVSGESLSVRAGRLEAL